MSRTFVRRRPWLFGIVALVIVAVASWSPVLVAHYRSTSMTHTLAYFAISDSALQVQTGATDADSGTNLKTTYTAAKALTPGGNALSAVNRAAVIVPAGRYDFGTSALDVDTEFVDFVGVGECRLSEDGTIRFPLSVLIVDTDTEVVNATTRNVHMTGFHVVQETDGAGNRGLVIDNADAADRSRFIDIGVTMPGITRKAIDDGTNTDVGSYFEQCHSLASVLPVGDFSGTANYCSSGGNGFGITMSGTCNYCIVTGNDGFGDSTMSGTCNYCIATGDFNFGGLSTMSGTCNDCIVIGDNGFGGGTASATAIMRRCRYSGSDGIKKWQGLMEACVIEVAGTDKNAVEILARTTGTSRTDSSMVNSDTDTLCFIDVDYTADFPVGDYVENVTNNTWHLIVSSVLGDGGDSDGNDDTVVTVGTAAAAQFDGLAVQAYSVPRIIGCTLIATGSGASVDTDALTPAVLAGNTYSRAIDGNVIDVIVQDGGTQTNVTSEHLVTVPE